MKLSQLYPLLVEQVLFQWERPSSYIVTTHEYPFILRGRRHADPQTTRFCKMWLKSQDASYLEQYALSKTTHSSKPLEGAHSHPTSAQIVSLGRYNTSNDTRRPLPLTKDIPWSPPGLVIPFQCGPFRIFMPTGSVSESSKQMHHNKMSHSCPQYFPMLQVQQSARVSIRQQKKSACRVVSK